MHITFGSQVMIMMMIMMILEFSKEFFLVLMMMMRMLTLKVSPFSLLYMPPFILAMMIAFICWCAANTMIVFGMASPCFLDNLSLPQKDSEKEIKAIPWESTSSSSSR